MEKNLILLFSVLIFSCSSPEEQLLKQTIAAHGAENLNMANVSFDFRDYHYDFDLNNGLYIYTRSITDSLGIKTEDRLKNEGFERLVDGKTAIVSDSLVVKYSNSINSVAYFYQRWEGPAQHKVHATPIQPTHGESVDHQSSLRTPNLSGGSRDEIVQLGIDILFEWAKEDGLEWSQERYDILRQRAWNDKVFPAEFYAAIWNRDADIPNMNYNLRGLYERLKNEGWQNVFTPLPQNHHILVVRQAGLQ